MATSDRLYELSCECRDNEEALERIRREVARLEAVRRAALELAEALDDPRVSLTGEARSALHGLRQLE